MDESCPWLRFYGRVPTTLDYPPLRVDELVTATALRMPDHPAYELMGRVAKYRELHKAIDHCAAGLYACGLRDGDRITIAMPTSPQGVVAFYAASRLGAVSSLVHPLSTPDEIAHYLRLSRSRMALTLDLFYERFDGLRERTPLETLVLARMADELPLPQRAAYLATTGRRTPHIPKDAGVVWWRDVMSADGAAPVPSTEAGDLATILYSGGTTGAPKGIALSHRNVNSEAIEVASWVGVSEHDVILAVLPIFHGFGLAAQVHVGLISGAKLVMVPRFSPSAVAKLIRNDCPTLMAGVPTLYESLTRDATLRNADLSRLRAAFSGADVLQASVREGFERLVAEGGGRVALLEGYGLTEAVTAVIGSPLDGARPGSVGIPFPDVLAKICAPGTDDELRPGEEGEICVSGPPVMLGYLDDPAATAEALKVGGDGRTWLHTGDLGRMDADGYFWFTCRLKRMIKSSGFNVYPAQVEAALAEHPAVQASCVIGVPDTLQGERVKAFVVPHDSTVADEELAAALIAHCRERLLKWSCPREIEFRDALPMTRFGKVDYRALSEEARAAAALREPAPVM